MTRTAFAAAAVVALLVAAAAPAAAVGVADVELEALVGRSGAGDLRLDVTATTEVTVQLHNTADERRTVRVYPAAALDDGAGSYAVAGAGSAPWLVLDDGEVTLQPGEVRRLTATVRPDAAGAQPGDRVAFVIETTGAATLVTRAASVVEVVGLDPIVPRPLPLLLAALALVLAVGGAVTRRVTRRQPAATVPAAA